MQLAGLVERPQDEPAVLLRSDQLRLGNNAEAIGETPSLALHLLAGTVLLDTLEATPACTPRNPPDCPYMVRQDRRPAATESLVDPPWPSESNRRSKGARHTPVG